MKYHLMSALCALAVVCLPSTSAAQATDEVPKQDLTAEKSPYQTTAPYGSGFNRELVVRSEFELEIGGHIKLDAIADSQQIDSDLPFFALPEQIADPGGSAELVQNPKADTFSMNLAARELLLNLSIATPSYGAWSANGYIEFNFLGFLEGQNPGSPTPILRHGYATLSNSETGTSLLFGQAQGPFGPIDPQTVNWETYVLMGDIFTRLPQIRLTQSFGEFTASVAAVRPADYLNDSRRGFDVTGRGQDSGLPEAQARLSYALPGQGHYWFFDVPGAVGLSGRFARERFNAGSPAEEDVSSWTVAADFLVPFGPLTLSGEAYYGQNTDNVYGLAGVAGTSEQGGFDPSELVSEFGGWAQLGWNVSDRWYASVIYGLILPDADTIRENEIDNGQNILSNQALTSNLYFRILPTLFVAAEYVYLRTNYLLRADIDVGREQVDVGGELHRGQLAFLFSF